MLGEVVGSLKEVLAALTTDTHGKTGTTSLGYLSYHVKAATKRRRYEEIAQLIACMRGQPVENVVLYADAIRRSIQRYVKHDPDFFRQEQEEIEDHLFSWRQWQSARRPIGH
jgi:hypothetical protein